MRPFPLLPFICVLAVGSGAGCSNLTPDPPATQEAPPAGAEAPATPTAEVAGPASENNAPQPPADAADDGLRLPDMLGLPSDREIVRPAAAPDDGGGSEIIARPPAGP